MQRVVLCLTVSLALVFSASLGAAAAGAQAGAPRSDELRVSTKTVKKWMKRQARVVGEAQPSVFPNAYVERVEPWARCRRFTRRKWFCTWFVSIYEESTLTPPQYKTRKSTVRFCRTPGFRGYTVRRARSSRKLRILGSWRASCPVDEMAIDTWNRYGYGPDWQPTRSEPIPVPQSTLPVPKSEPRDDLDLLPAPSGEPGAAPPGPLSTETRYLSSSGTVRTAAYPWRGFLVGCSQWVRYALDPRYWIYFCYWQPPSGAELPGAALGIFSNPTNPVTYWEAYYWAGNDNYGRPFGRLFWSGQY
jgi:hypothetical protein